MDIIYERVAGLDVHKAMIVACVRVMADGKAERTCRTYDTTTDGLKSLLAWLMEQRCTHVAMEATGVYWKPVWNILSDGTFELLVANAAHIKNVPGRKTDVNDATWIANLLACGLIKGSFVPCEEIQQLRTLLRSRKQLTREQTSHTQRIQKTLEEANIKLDTVISEILGVSGRRMIEAMIAGVTSPLKLAALADRRIKATIPGPFTMSRQAQDDYYGDEEAMAMDFADAVNAEIKDLFAAGADVVQLDEPWMQQYPDKARAFGLDALNRALNDVSGTVAVHLCFGYAAVVHEKPSGYSFLAELENTKAQQISIEAAQPRLDVEVLRSLPGKTIILGVIDLADTTIETPEMVAARIRAALAHVTPERLVIAPDCGMKYLPRAVAYGKMKAMVDGARIVRQEVC